MLSLTDSITRFGIAAALLAGCVETEQWTREKQTAVTVEAIPNASVASTVRAAENVVKLAGGTNISFDYRPDGFVAYRRYSAYFVIGAVSGTYIFDFTAKPGSGGTVAELRISQNATSYTAVGAIPEAGTFWDLEGAYNLFFDRVKAQTGSGSWVACPDAPGKYGLSSTHFEPLCIAAQDRTP